MIDSKVFEKVWDALDGMVPLVLVGPLTLTLSDHGYVCIPELMKPVEAVFYRSLVIKHKEYPSGQPLDVIQISKAHIVIQMCNIQIIT